MTVTGGPYVNLSPTGQVIHLSSANYPTNAGFYVIECVAGENGSRPRWCNAAIQLWISKEVGACEIRANAPGLTDTYYDLWQTLSFKIR